MYRFYLECEPRAIGREQLESGAFRIKTRWTKALGEAVTVVYGDSIEDMDLSKHSGAGDHETTMRHLS